MMHNINKQVLPKYISQPSVTKIYVTNKCYQNICREGKTAHYKIYVWFHNYPYWE
jgi:hypothetical protein